MANSVMKIPLFIIKGIGFVLFFLISLLALMGYVVVAILEVIFQWTRKILEAIIDAQLKVFDKFFHKPTTEEEEE